MDWRDPTGYVLDPPLSRAEWTWRAVPIEVPALDGGLRAWLQHNPARIALGFDLSAPLAEQLAQARMTLLAERRARQRAGRLGERRVADAAPRWTPWPVPGAWCNTITTPSC